MKDLQVFYENLQVLYEVPALDQSDCSICYNYDLSAEFLRDNSMTEWFAFTGEGLPHYLQQWTSSAVKFRMPMMLFINFVYISVSYMKL